MFCPDGAEVQAGAGPIFLGFEGRDNPHSSPVQTQEETLVRQHDSAPVAVITGAGTRIGAATALRYAVDGYPVALVGRTEATLQQITQEGPEGAEMHPWAADARGARPPDRGRHPCRQRTRPQCRRREPGHPRFPRSSGASSPPPLAAPRSPPRRTT
ncbi:SDR family NAD(P)-dependent oxidoreductase [Streptomyces sp. NPDC048045]|uniref:SDR family NAD(P)-dependent oxidoreductase n=1 Tax=Streptomyces sp. NPDC048045 TaxID=3154710 RepID=UPI00341D9E7B